VQSAQPSPEAAPARPPSRQAAGPRDGRISDRAEAAQELAVNYLNSWSAPNPVTLETTSDFYAPRVLFYGRPMDVRALIREKRRFVQRWPERQYRPHEDTMRVACDPERDVCTVQSVFDFTAANPERRRISQGIAALQLVVSFEGERPLIVAESSTMLGRGNRNVGLEGAFDD